ncbi:MAG: dolichyl-phosphate beta-glucosyltransferase [Dehalococcoidia bacterium]|jgi:dolichyl-phosphate beta-glucosyltransferase
MAVGPASEQPYVSLVLPAYNEERRLGASLRHMADYLGQQTYECEILVVDDGSTDATADVAEKAAASMPETVRLRVLSHHQNLGKGAAVKTGCLAASGRYVLFLDVDLATPPEDCGGIIAALARSADVAAGTRLQPEGFDMRRSQPRSRRLMGRLFTDFRKLLLLPDIEDTQCPLKGFRREAAQCIFARQRLSGWAFDVEILYLARRLGMKIEQIPVSWRHVGGSKLRMSPPMALRVFWDLLRLRFLYARTARQEVCD